MRLCYQIYLPTFVPVPSGTPVKSFPSAIVSWRKRKLSPVVPFRNLITLYTTLIIIIITGTNYFFIVLFTNLTVKYLCVSFIGVGKQILQASQ